MLSVAVRLLVLACLYEMSCVLTARRHGPAADSTQTESGHTGGDAILATVSSLTAARHHWVCSTSVCLISDSVIM